MLVIARRRASGHAPENTMAAFRKAVAQGATFIETDLQLSREAHLVAVHDDTVNPSSTRQQICTCVAPPMGMGRGN